MKKKSNIRKYVNWVLTSITVILLCFIASKLYKIYENNKLNESVLSRVVGTIQYDDVDDAISELVSNDFIFISYVKSIEVRKLETSIKKTVVDNSLQSNFFYLDVTDLMLNKDYIDDLNKRFSLKENNKIVALPALLYYKDGVLIKTISSSKDEIMSSNDFDKLLDNYEIVERKEK